MLLISTSHQFEFICKFKTLGWDDSVSPAFGCTAMDVNVTVPKKLITSLRVEHPVGASNDKVNTLLIYEQICEYFPAGLDKYFKGLLGIAIQKSGLKRITRNDLRPFGDLKSLSLFGNKLIVLESNLFYFNPKLELISLFQNNLQHVSPNILDGLVHLRSIYLNSNPCINEDAKTKEKIEQIKSKVLETCPATELMIEFAEVDSENLKFGDEINKLNENYEAILENLIRVTRQLEKSQKIYELVKNQLVTIETERNFNGSEICPTLEIDFEKCESERLDLIDLVQELEIVDIFCTVPVNDATQCNAEHLKILKTNMEVKHVKNVDKTNLKGKSITKLFVINQQTLFLPSNLSNFLPKLNKIIWENSELIAINNYALVGLNGLTELSLKRNKIVEIKSESFKHLVNLQHLDLSYNKISIIETTAFNNLNNLIELHLNNNFLVKIERKIFLQNKNLRTLTLGHNQLKQIPSNFFLHFVEIEVLDLTENFCIDSAYPEASLNEIIDDITANCTIEIDFECRFELNADYWCHAENVDIDSPNIRVASVKGNHVNNLTVDNVTALKIVGQSLKFVPQKLSVFLPNLSTIIVDRSKLKVVDETSFEGFRKLKKLAITGNNLTTIEDEVLDNLLGLEVLDLSSNSIANLTESFLQAFNKLKVVNLSYNRLTNIEIDLILSKNGIEEFNFSHNKINSIDPQIIKRLKMAKLINFEGNVCIDSKYEADRNEKKKLMELFGEISFKCINSD